jgi:hypothetical protein
MKITVGAPTPKEHEPELSLKLRVGQCDCNGILTGSIVGSPLASQKDRSICWINPKGELTIQEAALRALGLTVKHI